MSENIHPKVRDEDLIELPAWVVDLELTPAEIGVCVMLNAMQLGYGQDSAIWQHESVKSSMQGLKEKGILSAELVDKKLTMTLNFGEQP